MVYISEHITYYEATHSFNAVSFGLDNIPNENQLNNIRAYAKNVFEPWRYHIGCPHTIDVLFRSGVFQTANDGTWTSVNKLANGVDNSQHCCLNGNAAADTNNTKHTERVQNSEAFVIAYNALDVKYDQLIAENIDESGHVDWNHSSFDNEKAKQRRQSLVSFFVKENGLQIRKYRLFDPLKGFIRSRYLLEREI
jgi:hypothetical protein